MTYGTDDERTCTKIAYGSREIRILDLCSGGHVFDFQPFHFT